MSLNSCSCKLELELIVLLLSQIINSYFVRNHNQLMSAGFIFEYFLMLPREKD